MAERSSSRRSFVVQVMSTAAGAWVGVSTGGLLAWISGCASGQQPGTSSPPPPPATVAEPEPDPGYAQPPATSTMATGPDQPPPEPQDAGYEPSDPPPAPVVKYGGPPDMGMPPGPSNEVKPLYGGSSVQPPPLVTTKYGGVMRPKYGGPPMPRKYGGPPPMDGGVY